jgi:hypothetical protein
MNRLLLLPFERDKSVYMTKYGYFTLSYYEEFGAKATPSGRQLMFSAAF